MLDYYGTTGVREICHRAKNNDNDALTVMAKSIVSENLIPAGSLLVPAPQHTGRAIYTKRLAEMIAEMTNASVADVLVCMPHMSRYEEKYLGVDTDFGFRLLDGTENLLLNSPSPIFFVDNVISTGKTFYSAQRVLQSNLVPLVYAADFSKLNRKYIRFFVA